MRRANGRRENRLDLIWQKFTDWLKEILIGGIKDALSGLFDTVNTRVGEIAGQVGATPQGWNGGIYNMIRSLSDNVILPIAGVILAIVMTMELIQIITDKNNMHGEVDTWFIFKWVFKTACAVLIVSNTWNIVMGVFDVAQSVVNNASGVVVGNVSLDLASSLADLEARLNEMEVWSLLGHRRKAHNERAEHLHLHHRVRAHDRNLSCDLHRPDPHGDGNEPGMGADGTELSQEPVRPRLSGLPHYHLCRHLRCACTEHDRGYEYFHGHLELYGLYGAFVLHTF